MSLWRASLAEPVVATFQSWSKEPVAIGAPGAIFHGGFHQGYKTFGGLKRES